jgi:AAA+ superfamily predicted ATPase
MEGQASNSIPSESAGIITTSYPPSKADFEIESLVRAKYTLVYVVTWEEQRVIDSLDRICDVDDIQISGVQVWDVARGLRTSKGFSIAGGENLTSPEQVLDYIAKKAEENSGKTAKAKAGRGPIYVLCDLFRYLSHDGLTPEIERRLRNLFTLLRLSTIRVFITSPELQLPTALEKSVTVVDYPLPGKEQLVVAVQSAKEVLHRLRKKMSKAEYESPCDDIVRALMGLTIGEADDALAKSWVVTGKFDIKTILELKRQIIRKGQLLDYVCSEESMENVGGFAGVKEFVGLRKNAFGQSAEKYGLPTPKGIFLLGVQGSGKSLCAKAVANELQFPLLKLSMGRMFASLVGESEQNMRRALQLAESVAPCVLLVDEVDKALSGATGAQADSGTTRRVIGQLVDWMQEKTSPVFIVACANSIAGLPPELMRKGRFDEMFFVDLPTADERRDIFAIHIKKYGRDQANFDLDVLAGMTEGFSGAEIDGVISDAMFNAFGDGGREFSTNDVKASIGVCVPLSKVKKEEIDELRESSRNRMRSASAPIRKGTAETNAAASRFDL